MTYRITPDGREQLVHTTHQLLKVKINDRPVVASSPGGFCAFCAYLSANGDRRCDPGACADEIGRNYYYVDELLLVKAKLSQ